MPKARCGTTVARVSVRRYGNEKQDSISSIGSDGGRSLLQTMPNLGRGQSVADACKGTRIPRERREAPNPLYLQELAKALDILPPYSIHQVTEALERLMEEDAAADRPFIAALAISKARGGLPAPGFFDCARRLGRYADGQDARTFHTVELNAVFARWGGSGNN
jgi:hypothetical protein